MTMIEIAPETWEPGVPEATPPTSSRWRTWAPYAASALALVVALAAYARHQPAPAPATPAVTVSAPTPAHHRVAMTGHGITVHMEWIGGDGQAHFVDNPQGDPPSVTAVFALVTVVSSGSEPGSCTLAVDGQPVADMTNYGAESSSTCYWIAP